MPPPSPRRSLLPLWIAAALALCLPFRLLADLTWTPGKGWQVEGGALSGLTGASGRSALDMMNRARQDEESGSHGSAMRLYEKVAKRYSASIYAPEALFRAAQDTPREEAVLHGLHGLPDHHSEDTRTRSALTT